MKTQKKPKVALGMSGGVDSSLSAYLLVEQGYDVTGVYLECWRAPGCRSEEDRKDALKVALELGIPFQVLDFKKEYKERVVEDFFRVYESGRTPNPDVLCNKEIKFGLFYDWAMENGFDYVATGHYAKIGVRCQVSGFSEGDCEPLSLWERTPGIYRVSEGIAESKLSLFTSKDSKKDQTYFLYRLRQEQLAHILFPIGHLTKAEVRKEAVKRNIPVAEKPDSQGICFIGEINVHNFLKERLGEHPGEVVNTAGEVMGRHNGLWFYTIGQRHGFEIFGKWKSAQGGLKHAMPPYYVIRKIPETNQLVVGFGAETFCSQFEIEEVHWICRQVSGVSGQVSTNINNVSSLTTRQHNNITTYVRIRHGGKLIQVSGIRYQVSGKVSIKLAEPVQGIAEGQSAVLYGNVECGVWSDGERRTKNLVSEKTHNPYLRRQAQPTTHNPLLCLGGGVISG